MVERTKRTVFFQRPVPVLSILIVVIFVIVAGFVVASLPPGSVGQIIGELVQGGDGSKVTETEQTPQSTSTPTATQQPPTQTPRPTSTSTPTTVPTQTAKPTPRILSEAGFEFLMFANGSPVSGIQLLRSGWYLYDGEAWSDEFPCPSSCIFYKSVVDKVIWGAYEQNKDADDWCEWLCLGVANDFASPYNTRGGNFYNFKEMFGNPDREPFCPQFTGEYEDFSCNSGLPETRIPSRQSYGWPEEVRREIEQKYLIPIISDGWPGFPGVFNGVYNTWLPRDVADLADSEVCYGVANGHYWFAFPEYEPKDLERDFYLRDGMRRKLREKLNNELGVSINGNPPLCPGVLDMIEPPNLP